MGDLKGKVALVSGAGQGIGARPARPVDWFGRRAYRGNL